MKVKKEWSEKDFNIMGWHDATLYEMYFPNENHKFILNLDYIFKWVKSKSEEKYSFWVSRCKLSFHNVTNLKINLNFENGVGIYIHDIERKGIGLTPNGKMMDWQYEIETDKGQITFITTGFIQEVISNPILSDSQSLPHEFYRKTN